MILNKKLAFAACVCILSWAGFVHADTPEGFYDQEQVKGFISIKGDFRQIRSDGLDAINSLLFESDLGIAGNEGVQRAIAAEMVDYKRFEENYLGLHAEVGAAYKQFLTWFDIDFMPTQVSERPSQFSENLGLQLYDVKWNTYGANWMFGWQLLPAEAPINIIPSVGAGFSLLNVHFPAMYVLITEEGDTTKMLNRTYSTLGKSFNGELEVRLRLGQMSLGGYAGYKVVRYNAVNVENVRVGSGDLNGDNWFVGAKLTWTMLSAWERKQREKL